MTLNARTRTLYNPLRMVVPFAKVGVSKLNKLNPLSAGSYGDKYQIVGAHLSDWKRINNTPRYSGL